MLRRGAWWLLLVTVGLAGCEERRRSSPRHRTPYAPSFDAAPSVPVQQGAAPSIDALPTIRLDAAGDAPRAVLRYEPKPRGSETIAMTMRVTARHRIPGAPVAKMKLGVRFVMKVSVAEKLPQGQVRYRFEIVDAQLTGGEGVDAVVLSSNKADVKRVIGTSGTVVVDRRGFRMHHTLTLPDAVSDLMKQNIRAAQLSLDQLSSPFPKKAVGVGAKWEHLQTVVQNGIRVEQTTAFELVALKHGRGTLRFRIGQTAPRQVVTLPGLPDGVETEVLSWTGSGSGELSFDLWRFVPLRASVNIESDTTLAISADGQAMQATMQAVSELVVEKLSQ